jgi:hypothetical protein
MVLFPCYIRLELLRIHVSDVPFPIPPAQRFPVWKQRSSLLTCVDYFVLLGLKTANNRF